MLSPAEVILPILYGVGMAPEHIPHIFDEFAQLRNPERDRAKGSGLGLAISKRLVEVMGASIEVESKLGAGSSFTVAFPSSSLALRLNAAIVDSPSTILVASGRGGKGPLLKARILLVEDHITSREGIRSILIEEGATVVEAPDARSALRRLEDGGFDIVLLDMMLPDLDGREVLKVIQHARPAGLRCVMVLPADLTPERQEEIRRLGGDCLIGKPVDVGKLMQALRQYLGDGKN